MGRDESLDLEKLEIKQRLEKVEDHMKVGEENRKTLLNGFDDLKSTVKSMETTLFGQNGQTGLVQKMDAFLKIAEGIQTVLTRIFVSICSAMVFAALPSVFKYLSQVLAHHTGG